MKTLRPVATVLQSNPPTTFARFAPLYSSTRPRPTNHERQTRLGGRRTFLSNPFAQQTTPQRITATRTLPYPANKIYAVISDVGSYSSYLPYVQQSLVTRTSNIAPDGKVYPEEGKLTIGFGDQMREEFWSRVYCVPDSVVEAVSGKAETTIPEGERKHHTPRPRVEEDKTRKEDVLSHILTRWSLRPVQGQAKTEVSLGIEVQFTNPLYAAFTSSAVPKVAEKVIDAFEKRLDAVVAGKVR